MLNYQKVFSTIVEETESYLISNRIQSMVLGISGGIDSTVVAAVCYEVSKRTGIPLIGRSLPTKHNKEGEVTTADLVGNAFCDSDNYIKIMIQYPYVTMLDFIWDSENFIAQTDIAMGNIQARLRMIYLYNLANVKRGIVFSTDNATEYNLGFWTLHGDVGDFNPLFGLWKTEVYDLARWLVEEHYVGDSAKIEAISKSMSLVPTDGLGISNSDLEQIGANTYDEVDLVLNKLLAWKKSISENLLDKSPSDLVNDFLSSHEIISNIGVNIDIVRKVVERHFFSSFKRKNLPIVINREKFERPENLISE